MSALRQYLDTYAEADAMAEFPVPQQPWECAVVVPALAESELISATLGSLSTAAGCRRVVAIVVVNARENHDQAVHNDNARLLQKLSQSKWDNLDLIIIDRATTPRHLPEGQGVGLARKIGADVAVQLFSLGRIQNPYVFMTDGDALVDPDYFQPPRDLTRLTQTGLGSFPSVLLHPFSHECLGEALSPLETSALQQYDQFLRYYERGLRYAGSPYAFPALGSTLCFHVESYAEVRGFPKREAGEDFYFLSKMAQVGKIYFRDNGQVTLRDRRSARVPFGTGAALSKISSELAKGQEYRVLNPASFERLKEVLGCFEFGPEKWIERFTDKNVRGVLNRMKVPEAIQQAWNTRPRPQDRLRHLHTWFDALKTLKFLHGLRDSGYDSIPITATPRWEQTKVG